MKYLIVSDIHGSYDSSLIILDKYNKLKCDKVLLLGDILYHGPRNDLPNYYNPKKVIEHLNSISDKIIAIKGNCDAEVDQMVLNFNILDDYILTINNKDIYLSHGHHVNYTLPTNKEVDIVIHGHTHIIRKDVVNNITYINIGSITIPKENTKRCYGMLENNNISIFDIDDNLLLSFDF